MESPKSNLEDLELLRQFKTKCVNQCERTRREVGAVLREKFTAFDAELDKICGNAGRVDEDEEDAEENDKLDA